MDLIRKWYVKATEWQRAQTMSEYALIMAAIAVICFAGYQTMGTEISSVLVKINGDL